MRYKLMSSRGISIERYAIHPSFRILGFKNQFLYLSKYDSFLRSTIRNRGLRILL